MAEMRVYDAPLTASGRAELRLHGTMPARMADAFAWFFRLAAPLLRVGYSESGRARHVDD